MTSYMAMERESSGQEEVSSFASLLRTFLPDHSDLPLVENTEQLLQQVSGSLAEGESFEEKQLASRGLHSPSQRSQNLKSAVGKMPPSEQEKTSDIVGLAQTLDTNEQRKNKSLDEAACDDDEDSDATIDVPLSETSEKLESMDPVKTKTIEESKRKEAVQFSSGSSQWPCSKHYACFICDGTFKELASYTTHMASHCVELAVVKCSDCGDTLNSREIYNNHRRLFTYELYVDRTKARQPADTEAENLTEEYPFQSKRKRKGDQAEPYTCNVCGKGIFRYSAYLKHIRNHGGTPAFTCAVCQESFQAPCQLRYHIDMQHSHVMPFQCKLCLRRFKMRCSLSTHLKYCDVDPSCIPFAEEMQFIDQLSQQRKYQGTGEEEEGMSQYSCPICTVMFDSPEELKEHMSYHDETKPYKCEQCGRGFRSKRMRQKHYAIHQTKHDCRCEICGVQLLTLSGYNAHLRGHRNQEILQAQFFPDSSADVSGDNTTSEPAFEILQRLRSQGENKSHEKVKPETVEKKRPSRGGFGKKLKKYKCPVCGLMFFSGGEKFQAHARKEHKDAEFEKCTLCPKIFLGKENLERHVKLHKMYTETYPCEECGKTFRRRHALQVHKKMHSFKKFVKCDICGQEFRFVSEVDKHKNNHHRYDRMLNIYKCNICGQRFPMLSHLSVHCYCHNVPDSRPFECDLCKVSFKTSIELKQHIYQKHDELMKKLGDSTYVPDTGTFLTFTTTTMSGFEGVVIKQEEIAPETMNNKDESDKEHDRSKVLSAAKSDQSRKVVPADAISKSDLPNVDGREVGDNKVMKLEPNEDELILPSNVEAYNLAARQFSHQAKILKRYTCEVCEKAFSSNSDLKTHRRTHSGETPFKCEYCDRSFKQRGHRKLHIQVVHTKEMPYKCEQCDSAFPTRYRYQVHVKRHSGVKEHPCPYCEKEFYTLGKLNEHKKKRHPSEYKEELSKADNSSA